MEPITWHTSKHHDHEWAIVVPASLAAIWPYDTTEGRQYQWWAMGPALNAGGFEPTPEAAKAVAEAALASAGQ